MRRPSGFTLLELLVAGTISVIVVMGGFLALTHLQQQASDQRRSADLVSQARLAMELMTQDIRAAGDSQELLPVHCIAGMQAAGTPYQCPAILDPHPWRLTLGRNTWAAGADGVQNTMDDQPPQLAFNLEPNNVVTYQFVPDGGPVTVGRGGHQGVLGRLERIVNPFQFNGQARQVTVLLDRVLLDNRMRTNPANPTEVDARYDYSMFMYQLLSATSGEFNGEAVYTARSTRQTSFLLPPVRFFDPLGTYTTYEDSTPAAPWLPNYGAGKVIGLHDDSEQVSTLRTAGTTLADDLRFVLDYNRIRTVRVAFKVVEPRDDPDFAGGVDLVADSPGTARVYPFETTVELKVFSAMLD